MEQLTGVPGSRSRWSARAATSTRRACGRVRSTPSLEATPQPRVSHLVFDAKSFANPTAALTIPIPGELDRFAFAMPEQLGRITRADEDVHPARFPMPTVFGEITFLLDTVNTALYHGRHLADTRKPMRDCAANRHRRCCVQGHRRRFA